MLNFLASLLLFLSLTVSGFSRSSENEPIYDESHPSKKKDEDSFLPWFTGPLIAPAGRVVPVGHTNWEPYLYVTDNIGVHSHQWKHVAKEKSVTVNPLIDLTHGLTEWMDIQIISGFLWNFKNKKNDFRYDDTTIYLGFQALKDKKGTMIPDLRITVQESFPSGHYQYFDPKKNGTDNTGNGSFETGFSFTFQKLFYLHPRLLRLRWNIGYMFPSKVHVHSFNAYGGGFGTDGIVKPGGKFATILSGEYTLTQSFTLALDVQYICDSKRTFKGIPGIKRDGTIADLNGPAKTQLSLAPAIEYNFNKSVGLVAGVWFSVTGSNSKDFISGVFALNIYK
ncbi:MAG: hypothetical protein S4CHLAM37_16170 [Chlamydiia bacterium]|nr:hypothetical protein [Chlamydiia bacterium]